MVVSKRVHFGKGLYSEFDELNNVWWVVIPDDQWAHKECMFYYEGIPIYTSWTRG